MWLGSLSSVRGPSAPRSSGPQTAQQHAGVQSSSSVRIKHIGPEPTRYVDFLACQGYVVEILSGKHFKTPDGEFVEMKSGTQYKIHVKNTHAYGKKIHITCIADITQRTNRLLDGRDMMTRHDDIL